ncbi:MAG: hypothetical protein MZU97_22290 [Bacillus subtilis]|nr:hypothetical protein [Bacillus subtilis]
MLDEIALASGRKRVKTKLAYWFILAMSYFGRSLLSRRQTKTALYALLDCRFALELSFFQCQSGPRAWISYSRYRRNHSRHDGIRSHQLPDSIETWVQTKIQRSHCLKPLKSGFFLTQKINLNRKSYLTLDSSTENG